MSLIECSFREGSGMGACRSLRMAGSPHIHPGTLVSVMPHSAGRLPGVRTSKLSGERIRRHAR
jgi:hypothetical protein